MMGGDKIQFCVKVYSDVYLKLLYGSDLIEWIFSLWYNILSLWFLVGFDWKVSKRKREFVLQRE